MCYVFHAFGVVYYVLYVCECFAMTLLVSSTSLLVWLARQARQMRCVLYAPTPRSSWNNIGVNYQENNK